MRIQYARPGSITVLAGDVTSCHCPFGASRYTGWPVCADDASKYSAKLGPFDAVTGNPVKVKASGCQRGARNFGLPLRVT